MTAIHFVNLLSIICNAFLFGLCCICTALAYGKAKGHKPADWETEQETSKSIDNSCEDSPLSEPSAVTTEEEWETYKDSFLKPRAVRDKLGLMIEADTLIMRSVAYSGGQRRKLRWRIISGTFSSTILEPIWSSLKRLKTNRNHKI